MKMLLDNTSYLILQAYHVHSFTSPFIWSAVFKSQRSVLIIILCRFVNLMQRQPSCLHLSGASYIWNTTALSFHIHTMCLWHDYVLINLYAFYSSDSYFSSRSSHCRLNTRIILAGPVVRQFSNINLFKVSEFKRPHG